MNKTLHRFRLFALNRLSEAQKKINRSLLLLTPSKYLNNPLLKLLFLLFLTPTASATDYFWGYWTKYRSPSPLTSCQLIISERGGFSPWLNFTDPTLAWCRYSYINSNGAIATNGSHAVYRYGNSCPAGTTYNSTTGECANDEQKGPPPPNSCAFNPINIAIGNKYQAETDFPSSGASTLSFTRTYNSLDGLWRHNHSTHLRIAGTSIALVLAHGRKSSFNVSGTTVTASPTELGSLVKTADGWLYTAENNERFSFDAAGRLTRWTNSAGASQQLAYVSGKVTVTDSLGHSLSFTEDAQHQPLTLSTPTLQIAYSYNANKRLTQLIRTRGGQTEQRQFHYEDPRNNALLTGITDERGVRFATWSYDDKGRAISSEHAGGVEHGTVAYNADGSSTVTNELGKTTVYRFVSIGGIKRVSAVEGEASANCPNSNSTFTYDARGLLKTKTDNKGHLTTYDYNARGLEISRTEAAGTPQARTISTEWHPTLALPVSVTEPSRLTSYSYDAQGRQLSQTQTDR